MSRKDKVAEEIKREVSLIVQEELHDPRLGFITITNVDVTPDLRFARIFFSVYGDPEHWKKTQEGLEHASGFIRRMLGERLGLRFVPEIVFQSDHSCEYSILIEERLQEINTQKESQVKKLKTRKAKHATKKSTKRNKKSKK